MWIYNIHDIFKRGVEVLKRVISTVLVVAIVLSLTESLGRKSSMKINNFWYARLNDDGKTYGEIKTLAKAIECKVESLELTEVVNYDDDGLMKRVSEFKSGKLTAKIDEDDDNIFAELLGKTIDDETKLVTANSGDTPIYVGFGYIALKTVGNNEIQYKVEFFPKLRFKPFIVDAKIGDDDTNGNLELTKPSVEATIFKDSEGNWEKHNVFDTAEEARAALDALFVQQSDG